MTDDEPEWVATSPHGWGRGRFETDALQNMVPHVRSRDVGESMEIVLARFRGDLHVDGMCIRADEVLEKQTLDVDGDYIRELADLSSTMELTAEEAIVEAEDVE